jgi:hypothetical protein
MAETKKMIRHIRKVGREKIVERINAFKNNEHMPNDILSAILTSYSKSNEIFNCIENFFGRSSFFAFLTKRALITWTLTP